MIVLFISGMPTGVNTKSGSGICGLKGSGQFLGNGDYWFNDDSEYGYAPEAGSGDRSVT